MKKIYRAANPQDVKELFAIFDNIYENITLIRNYSESSFELQFINGNTDLYHTGGNLSFDIDFCGQSEIKRPVEIKVGMFGKFSDKNSSFVTYSFIKDIAELKFFDLTGCEWDYFELITADSDEGKKILKAMGGE